MKEISDNKKRECSDSFVNSNISKPQAQRLKLPENFTCLGLFLALEEEQLLDNVDSLEASSAL